MQIVGFAPAASDPSDVETIDIWYSRKRNAWCVERLDAAGNQIGPGHSCGSEAEALVCLDAWLRAHDGTRLIAPRSLSEAERHLLAHRRAA